MCIHRVTGHFYIGSRTSKYLKLPSHLDFPRYQTSSKIVKPNFDEYDWFIVAEFFDKDDAYDFEQYLIFEYWGNPLLLNKRCGHGHLRWSTAGTNKTHSADTRKKLSDKAKLRPPVSDKTKQKLREVNLGKKIDPDVIKRISDHHKQNLHLGNFKKGNTPWNAGLAGTGILKRSEEFKNKLRAIKRSEEFKANLRKPKMFYDIISSDGFIFENIPICEFVLMFNFKYNTIKGTLWKGVTTYRGFTFYLNS